jgi:hypothetical protein
LSKTRIERARRLGCLNGVLDSTEFGVDCGGTCQECDLVIPCANQKNRVTRTYYSTLVYPNHNISQDGSFRVISAPFTDGYLFFRFDGVDIETKTYEIIGEDPVGDIIGFKYVQSIAGYTTQSGSAYVSYNGEEISIDICNLEVASSWNDTIVISANLTVDI